MLQRYFKNSLHFISLCHVTLRIFDLSNRLQHYNHLKLNKMTTLKNIKATSLNYRKILLAMYEGTGNVYWLHKTEFDGQMKANFFIEFHYAKNELITFVNSGGVFKFPLINAGTKKPVPFIYNSIN